MAGATDSGVTVDTTAYWRRPAAPVAGMTSKELAEHQKQFTTFARGRILGTGADQYTRESGQRFEGLSVKRIIEETQEEIADIVNYAAMLSILLDRIGEKFSA